MTLTADLRHRATATGNVRVATQTVAEYIVEQLISASMTLGFGVHGANIEDLYDAATRAPGMTAVVAKHEFAAGAMADGTARMSGRPGVVMTTSGGGAMNVVPALAEAYDSRVPVLALIGTAPSTLVGRGAFQDMLAPPDTVDIAGVLSAVTGSCSVVGHADEVPAALATAFATLHRGLPAAVLLPKDVQSAPGPNCGNCIPGSGCSTESAYRGRRCSPSPTNCALSRNPMPGCSSGWVTRPPARRPVDRSKLSPTRSVRWSSRLPAAVTSSGTPTVSRASPV